MDYLKRSTPYPPADRIPVFRPDLETATGGFKLFLDNLILGSIVKAGSAASYDEITRICKIIKAATVYATVGATDVVINVAKGSGFKVGDIIAKATGGKASTITAIDPANALYDAITIDLTLAGMAAGDGIFQAAATSTTTTSAEYAPINGLVKNDIYAENNAYVDVVVKGTVYARRIPAIITALKAKLPLILFSNSK